MPAKEPTEKPVDKPGDESSSAGESAPKYVPTFRPLTAEQKSRLLGHFKEIQDHQAAAGIDSSGEPNH